MRIEAGFHRCEGSEHTIMADRPLSREQVDLIVAICKRANVDVHRTHAIEMNEGMQTVEWIHPDSGGVVYRTVWEAR